MFRKALGTLQGATAAARVRGSHGARTRAMRWLARLGMVLLATSALAAPATAQVMTITNASPSFYTGPGQTITFTFSYGQSNAITNSISLSGTSVPVSNFSCGGLPLAPNGSTTCTGTYTTTSADAWGVLLFGGFTALDGNGTPRGGQISNRYVVPNGDTPPQAQAFALVSSVSENGGQPLRFQVGLNKLAATPVTLFYTLGGTASAGSDYTPPGGSVTLPLGAMNWEVTVNPIGDATYEPNETVVVNIAPGTGYTIGSPASATGTITNDDAAPLPDLSISDVTVAEGNTGTSTATFTVNLGSPAPAGGVSFDIATANGSANAGSDYVARSLTGQTIPAGSSSYSFNVLVLGDTTFEANETFFANVSNVSGAALVDGQGLATITNDDAPPQANISVAPASVTEDGAVNLVFTVNMTSPVASATTVNFEVLGSATAGVDFGAIGTSVTVPAASSSAIIVVDPIVDTLFEPDESVSIGLLAGTGYQVGALQGASGTILDDDLQAQTITFANPGAQNFGTSPTIAATSDSGLAVAFTSATTAVCTITSGGVLDFITAGTCTINADQAGDATRAPAPTVTRSFTVNAVAPGAPTTGTATAGDGQATVSFTAPASNGGAAIIGYTVTSSPGGFNATGPTSPITLTGLANGTTYTFTVTANNSAGTGSASAASNAVTPAAPITLGPTTLPASTVGVAYSQAVTANGGVAPHAYAVTAGALPAGLTLGSNGVLSGTATAGGTFNFIVTATDSVTAPGPNSGSRAYSLTIAAASVALAPASLPPGMVGTAYAATLSANGGTAPYTFAVTAGVLPPGVSLSSSGAMSGTPATAGSFNFTVTTTDSSSGTGPYTASRPYSVTIANAVPVARNSTASVAYGAAGVIALDIDGVVDTVSIGTAPAHGTVSVSGTTATYTPAAGYAGADSFSFTAANDGGTSAPATVAVSVGGPVISVTAGGGMAAQVGVPYTQTFAWSGGRAPFSGFQVTGLPAGLSVTGTTSDTATVSGIPTEAGSFLLVATAIDASTGEGPFTGSAGFNLSVSAPTLALVPGASSFDAGYDTAFSQSFAASGGVGPYSYALSGALPAGMTFNGDTLS
ncbi:putative Ig domain-containing protein, partial [Marilutibacter aestuarii]